MFLVGMVTKTSHLCHDHACWLPFKITKPIDIAWTAEKGIALLF